MRRLSHSPLKTINLAHTIFYEEVPKPKDKTHMANRRLTCRNSYYNTPNNKSDVQRYEERCKSDVVMPQFGEGENQKKMSKGKGEKGKNQQLARIVRNGKAATETNERRRFLTLDPSKLKNTIFFNPTQQLNSPTRLTKRRNPRFPNSSKTFSPNQSPSKTLQIFDLPPDIKVNPYTKQKYTYLVHQHEDQLAELKRNARLKQQMSAFGQSYRIGPVELSPQKQRSRIEVSRPSPVLISKGKGITVCRGIPESPLFASKIYGNGMEPSPWQWGNPTSSIHRDGLGQDQQD